MNSYSTIAQGVNCSTRPSDSDEFMCEVGRVVDIMSYIAIGLAVGSVVLVGFLLVTSILGNNANVAATTIKRIFFILIGVTIVFSAPKIAEIALG